MMASRTILHDPNFMKVGLKRGGEKSGQAREDGQDPRLANNEILSCYSSL